MRIYLAVILLLISCSCAFAQGGGVLFDDVDDYIDQVSDTGDLTTSISISFWIYLEDDNSEGHVVQRTTVADQLNFQFKVRLGRDMQFVWRDAADNSYDGCLSSGAITSGAWHHIVATHRWLSADSTVIYVDGVDDTGSCARLTDDTPYVAGTQIFNIGRHPDDSSYFDGRIKDVWLWEGHVLTQAQVDLIFNSQLKGIEATIEPDNLYGGWYLDDCPDGASCDGVNFHDQSGLGKTLVGDDGANNTGLTGQAETEHSYWGH